MMEKEKQRRKLGFAILISLLLHLAVGYSLAAFRQCLDAGPSARGGALGIDHHGPVGGAAARPKNPQFIETEPSKESAEKPEEQTFESNANSKAASQLPATGNLPLPSQEGQDRPIHESRYARFLACNPGRSPTAAKRHPATGSRNRPPTTPPPKSQPSEPPKSTPELSPRATPEPEQLAMLTSTPPPPLKAPEETEPSPPPEIEPLRPPVAPRPKPETPASSYQSQKQQTRIAGSISNRGPSVGQRRRHAARALSESDV